MPDLYDKMTNVAREYIGNVAQAAEMCIFSGDTKHLKKELERLKKEYDAELDRLQKEAQITDA